ncbi:MAG: PD40 domain-containing protein [Planctomycetes bacterium]|nr:PD40 domain-containing protein [Planctomycetota bacterium]
MNADGSNQRELLAKDLHGWVFPAWSPDGQQLLFSGMLENGSIQLFVANADGKGAEQITNGDGTNSWAAWSPDGRYIAYIHYDKPPDPARGYALDPAGGRLMLIDLTSDTRRQVAPGDMRCFGCRPAWRPTRR